jgi:hypothetical protein
VARCPTPRRTRQTIDRLAGDCIPANVYGRLIDSNLILETGR